MDVVRHVTMRVRPCLAVLGAVVLGRDAEEHADQRHAHDDVHLPEDARRQRGGEVVAQAHLPLRDPRYTIALLAYQQEHARHVIRRT